MSNLKEKRIRKLKKKRIWPSIVGLFAISIVLFGVVVGILSLYIVDLIDKKFYDAYKSSYNVADYMCYDGDVSDIDPEELFEFFAIKGDIYDIAVLDESDNILWYGNDYIYEGEEGEIINDTEFIPNINEVSQYLSMGVYEDNYDIIIAYDEKSLMEDAIDLEDLNQNGSKEAYKTAADDILLKLIDKDIFLNTDTFFSERNVPVAIIEVWFVIYYNDYKVMVLNYIDITNNDLTMVFITFVLMILLTFVFVLYHICSVIGVARSQKRITKVLYTDMVTGGYNWLYFTKKGDKLLKRNRGKNNYAMLSVRMEKYRSFCTFFGVREGEELLEKLHLSLKKLIKRKEVMAHHDEADFGCLITYVDEADLLARMTAIEENLSSIVPNIKIYFEFGVCTADENDRDVDSLYNNAITALDLLPEDSDVKIAYYDVEMKKQQLWERKVEDEMDKALVTKQFKLYLQPKYSTKEEQLAGAEALVRWIHPVDGLIPPNRFIPIFEKNGFILQLDDYMIEEVAIQQSKWLSEGRSLFPISVNVSRAHFTREDLAEHICSIVDKYNVPHQFIELELTESAFFDDKYVLIDTVKKLRDYGFIVSMDDFGAGYSSLNSLKELSIDVLKIDADFFRGADSVERGMLIVSEVIDLAKKLDMKIVAEGIESREQVDFLTQQECDLIQGYYFAKPMSVDEFEEKYKTV